MASRCCTSEFKRERVSTAVSCAFCHEGEDSDDPDEDPLVPIATGKKGQKYAHEECLWWCPELTQADDGTWLNVGTALSRCHRLKCAVCGEGDAPLGCLRKSCRKNWHAPCAMEPTSGLVIYAEENCVACPICAEVLRRRACKKERQNEERRANGQKRTTRITFEEAIALKYPAARLNAGTAAAAAASADKTVAATAEKPAQPVHPEGPVQTRMPTPVPKASIEHPPPSTASKAAPKAAPKAKGGSKGSSTAGAAKGAGKAPSPASLLPSAPTNILSPLTSLKEKAPKASEKTFKEKGALKHPSSAAAAAASVACASSAKASSALDPPRAAEATSKALPAPALAAERGVSDTLTAEQEALAATRIAELFCKLRADDLPLQEVRDAAQLGEAQMSELMKRLDSADKFMLYEERVYLI